MKNKKIICIPFAYKPNMQSGENVFSSGDKRLLIYMKNASVALASISFDRSRINTFITKMIKNKLCEENIKTTL